jgi:hypothetical protein
MIKGTLKFLFYASYVFLIGLVLWQYSSVRNWQQIADGARAAQDAASRAATAALERADRCVEELQQESP